MIDAQTWSVLSDDTPTIEATLPEEATDERAAWEAMRAGLAETIAKARSFIG